MMFLRLISGKPAALSNKRAESTIAGQVTPFLLRYDATSEIPFPELTAIKTIGLP